MSKTVINSMITKMKKAGIVTKVSPWLHEQNEDARYVGLRLLDWQDIINPENNFLARFVSKDRQGSVQFFLANKPPFIFISQKNLTQADKWELILGKLRQRLNKDKNAYKSDTHQIDNLYHKLLPGLKK